MLSNQAPRRVLLIALLVAVPAVVAILAAAYGQYQRDLAELGRFVETEQVQLVSHGEKAAQAYLRAAVSDLFYLAGHRDVRALLDADFDDPRAMRELADDFARLARWKGLYEQVRLIDLKGMERLRVNHADGNVRLVPAHDLQNKSSRDYVRAGLALAPHSVYASRLDLNVEHGAVQRPLHPVLRLAAPLFDAAGIRRGLLVLNVGGGALLAGLDQLGQAGRNDLWLLNMEGYWLKASDPRQEWGFVLPERHGQRLDRLQPALWSRMQSTRSGHLRDAPGVISYRRFDPYSDVQRLVAGQGLAEVQVVRQDGMSDWVAAALLPAASYRQLVLPIQLRWLGIGGVLLLGVGGMLVLVFYQAVKRNTLYSQLALKQQCEDLINNLAVGVYRLTAEGRLVQANPAMLTLFNTDRTGWRDCDITAYMVPTQWSTVKARLDHGDRVQGAELACRQPDGGHRWLSITAVRAVDEAGATCYDGTALDVTAAKAAEQALRINEQKLRTLLESAPDAVLICDPDGTVVTANACAKQMFAIAGHQLDGLHAQTLFCDDGVVGRLCLGCTPGALGRNNRREELLARDLGGRRFTVEASSTPAVTDTGCWIVIIVRDVSARKHAEQQLLKFSRAVEQSANSIMFTDRDGRIEYVNRKFCELNGYTPAEVLGRGASMLTPGGTRKAVYRQLWDALVSKGEWRGELENQTKSGRRYWCLQSIFALRDDAGQVINYVTIGEDISERKLQEATIWRLAYYDTLTELPNRRMFGERLSEAVARARRHGQRLAVMYMDLDGFKNVNDSLGHLAGDRLLTLIAERFRGVLRETDVLARLGGDEFAIVLEDVSSRAAVRPIAGKLLACLREPVNLADGDVFVTASLGISIYPDDAEDADGLVKHADIAMYQGKDRGKDAVVFYQSAMSERVLERQQLESRLRRAVSADELFLLYQPKIDVLTGRCFGAEALVRWNSNGAGLVGPERFIAIAEDTGLINEIGDWVLRRAVADASEWRRRGHVDVGVGINVSGRQFRSGALGPAIREVLDVSGLPASALDIEITETVLVENLPVSVDLLKQLQTDGVTVSIDDFGTGLSSLSSLRSLPIDTLKIDRSFVTQLHVDDNARAIASSILGLAEALGLAVVAEGVESPRHREVLKQLGCARMQGYLFAKPMRLPEFLTFLRRSQGAGARAPAALN